MQIYLPESMYKQVKARGLPVSELLQKAVQAELRRQDLLAETDRYLADLFAEVGAPSAAQRTRAGAVARRLARQLARKAG
jgi:post-segregation antitoxin (ccd killing protein)